MAEIVRLIVHPQMEGYQYGEEDLQVKRQEARTNGEIVEAPLKTKNAY